MGKATTVTVRWKESIYFTGRNGTFKYNGVLVENINGRIIITPITSKGKLGHAQIAIPQYSFIILKHILNRKSEVNI